MILSANQKVAIGVVVGLVLGLGVGWFGYQYMGSSKNSIKSANSIETDYGSEDGDNSLASAVAVSGVGSMTDSEQPISPPAPIAGSAISSAVVVNDQQAGMVVEATMVTFTTPGWLVVHEDNAGALGNALGAARFDKGVFLGEVPLLRATVVGKTYHAVLYVDDGDKQFDLKKDVMMKDVDSKMVEDTFRAL
ncbi:MAG: hypothetical protein AAB597_00490 [Patescibacteria group bacterium]